MTDQEIVAEMTRLLARTLELYFNIEDPQVSRAVNYDLFYNGLRANPEIAAEQCFKNKKGHDARRNQER